MLEKASGTLKAGGRTNGLALLCVLGDNFVMPVPETTSAEAFARYVGGKVLRVGRGNPRYGGFTP